MQGNRISTNGVVKIAEAMYASEPCRICGKLITFEKLGKSVFAGYSSFNKSRLAHGECWKRNLAKAYWAFPIDAKD